MRIAVMAAGGVGGYFGGRLAAAGHDVHFIARGAHLDAIRAEGLRIESPLGDLRLADASATDDPATIGGVDVVIFAVKLWDTERAAIACRPLLKPDTLVVTFQNGVSSLGTLSEHLGAEHVAGGVAHIAAVIGAPGLIRHGGTMAKLTIGERSGGRSARIGRLVECFRAADVECLESEAIERAIWEKFVFLSALSGMTALCRQPIGPIRSAPDAWALFGAAVAETAAVARACGVDLPPDTEERTLSFSAGLPEGMKASMLHDLEAGRPLELRWLSGEVVRLGRVHGVATPAHLAALAALNFYSGGR
ncbi:ketopantoate reductase family protein [Lutibaculum baratangense]|uniref:2-dehydropantoate 2-reductase n=1 Tax=Lutibaculum baratangense AMV1 TaxID=631454 RepID=V4RGN3_9HYPH|nr:2-dehydropantoate 2-reductase [Lutibaculum baratangense]ESR24509.1 2-dehydropantoate 2-reductase [Lutibaculum baratangense AMV1]